MGPGKNALKERCHDSALGVQTDSDPADGELHVLDLWAVGQVGLTPVDASDGQIERDPNNDYHLRARWR